MSSSQKVARSHLRSRHALHLPSSSSSRPISNSDQNPAVTHAPLVLAIIIPKPFLFLFYFSRRYAHLQSRTAIVHSHHDALPSQLLRTARLDGFDIVSLKTATALTLLPLHFFYLNLSEQFCLVIPLLCTS